MQAMQSITSQEEAESLSMNEYVEIFVFFFSLASDIHTVLMYDWQ